MPVLQEPDRSCHDSLDINKDKFIGKPLASLYERHHASRKGFRLFLDSPDGKHRKPLGEDLNLSLLIRQNAKYANYPIAQIYRYYEQICVVINPLRED